MKTLINTKETYRVDTEAEVENFILEAKEDAISEGYELTSYSSTYKEKKSKGEVIDKGYMVVLSKTYSTFWEG